MNKIQFILRNEDKITSWFGKLGMQFVSTTWTHPRPLSWKERGVSPPSLFKRRGLVKQTVSLCYPINSSPLSAARQATPFSWKEKRAFSPLFSREGPGVSSEWATRVPFGTIVVFHIIGFPFRNVGMGTSLYYYRSSRSQTPVWECITLETPFQKE